MTYPKMHGIRLTTDAPQETDIESAVDRELRSVGMAGLISAGQRIAIAAGSRGIAQIDRILRHLVLRLTEAGAQPFLFPAMGSHGGGTAEGQLDMLASLGITEEKVGAPIHATMDTVEIGRSEFGFPVLVDRYAAEADGIIAVNRIKPHTDFQGPIESGLMKMLAIGMGKHQGCIEVHRQTVQFGYRDVIPAIGQVILDRLPVRFGLGIVENIYDATAMIRALPADRMAEGEAALLVEAKRLMARLPVDQVDVLIVDEMGKNISGTGMDTNVIGRVMFIGEPEPERPAITRVVVLNLTEPSHGNAIGIGLADYTTRRLADGIDTAAVATNAIAAMTPEKGRIPIALASDRAAVDAALATIGPIAPEDARVIHIKNTLELGEMAVSTALLPELADRDDLEVTAPKGPLAFDADDRLAPISITESTASSNV